MYSGKLLRCYSGGTSPVALRAVVHSGHSPGLLSVSHWTTSTAQPAPWIDAWERDARAAFLDGYFVTAAHAPFLPEDDAGARRVLAVFEVEKAAYEVVYEANNRPDWIAIPLRGVVSGAAALRPARTAGAA